MKDIRFGIIGCGLMGGSFALQTAAPQPKPLMGPAHSACW